MQASLALGPSDTPLRKWEDLPLRPPSPPSSSSSECDQDISDQEDLDVVSVLQVFAPMKASSRHTDKRALNIVDAMYPCFDAMEGCMNNHQHKSSCVPAPKFKIISKNIS